MRLSRCISTETEASIVKGHDMTTPSEDYRLIPLSRGQTAIVDAADYALVSQFTWYAHWCIYTKSYYARAGIRENGRQRQILMHRLILGLTDPKIGVDHVDRNTLDNRRHNMRIADHSENGGNTKKRTDNTSGFKGVSFHRQSGRWRAQIVKHGKHASLGLYPSAEAAHLAYCSAADAIHGEFARHA